VPAIQGNIEIVKNQNNGRGLGTECVHAGEKLDKKSGGVNTPIHTSTAHLFPNPRGKVRYPRAFNTVSQESVSDKMAVLEGGEAALVFSSGLGAISCALLGFLEEGDHLLIPEQVYGGTRIFADRHLSRFGIKYSLVHSWETSEIIKLINPRTRCIFFETPSNPLLEIISLKSVSDICREKKLISIIDNTFATPILQRPIEQGIDIVVHSGTKYLGGHSDLSSGALVGSLKHVDILQKTAMDLGAVLSGPDSYLLSRSLKTLKIRMERQSENAKRLATFLEGRGIKTYYPGLESHPGHEIAKIQMSAFGAILSFESDRSLEDIHKAFNLLKILKPAISLGGVESLICVPAETSHREMSVKERNRLGISEQLVRLSIGIEDIDDIQADLAVAFDF